MATITQPQRNLSSRSIVAYDEPPIKPPPILAVGPLAWIRNNLFKSTFDTILTLVAGFLLISLIVGILGWIIGTANWITINRNIRLFMVGTFPPDAVWRLEIATMFFAFAVGFTVYAYSRIRPIGWGIITGLLLFTVIAPTVIRFITPPLPSYLMAGSTPIASGTVTETPQEVIGFVARADETVTVRLAAAGDDTVVSGIAGFTDRAAQGLINGTINRLGALENAAAIENELATGLLTDVQRAALESDRTAFTPTEALTEQYAINRTPVQVALLDASGETVANATLTTVEDTLDFVLPTDGWYILSKTAEDGAALLRTTGIYPILQRDLSRGAVLYTRVTDDFETSATRPEIDGDDVEAMFLGDNQYQGQRPLEQYLRLSLAPFLELLARGFIPFAGVALLGYGLASAIATGSARRANVIGTNKSATAKENALASAAGKSVTQNILPYLWAIALITLFLLAYGVQALTPAELGSIIARFVWVGFMFFVGINTAQVWGRPLLGLGVVIGAALVLYSEDVSRAADGASALVGFAAEVLRILVTEGASALIAADAVRTPIMAGVSALIGIVVSLIVWLGVGIAAARMGAGVQQRISPARARTGVIVSAIMLVVAFILPILLIVPTAANNVLPIVDTRRWGGFLLTMILTVTSIFASFPLGVGLALGRRSSLPAVRISCTFFIELVRGVPLITVLFMAQLLVPLVNPELANVDNVIRAIIGLTLFSAAYLAENVRGGLQSIPPGQEEAAKALGLQGWQVTYFIMLPQALRAVIPALVGQCIALFKDTSLVALVGLTDLTGMSRAVIAQTEFIGRQQEVFFFIGVIYFVFCYLMAYISRRIEASGSGAARRI